MAKNGVSLTPEEKRVAKALLAKKWRNQDIQALINIGRKATINSGRITGVKKNAEQETASDEEVAFFLLKKRSYDPLTGLNLYDDERLIRPLLGSPEMDLTVCFLDLEMLRPTCGWN